MRKECDHPRKCYHVHECSWGDGLVGRLRCWACGRKLNVYDVVRETTRPATPP